MEFNLTPSWDDGSDAFSVPTTENIAENIDLILQKITDEEYFGSNRLGSTSLINFYKNGVYQWWHDKFGTSTEEINPNFEVGTMVHRMLLEPEEFAKHYMKIDGDKPSSEQEKQFCDLLVNGKSFENADITSAYSKCYSVKNKTPQAILKDALNRFEKLRVYVSAMSYAKSKNKKIIDHKVYDLLTQIKNNFNKNKAVESLMKVDEAYYERVINWDYLPLNVSCQSKIDLLLINHDTKEISIVDVKTTSTKSIKEFISSIKKYRYDMQSAFYNLAFSSTGLYKNYTIRNYYIVCSKTYPFEIKVLELNPESVTKAFADVEKAFKLYKDAENLGFDKEPVDDTIEFITL